MRILLDDIKETPVLTTEYRNSTNGKAWNLRSRSISKNFGLAKWRRYTTVLSEIQWLLRPQHQIPLKKYSFICIIGHSQSQSVNSYILTLLNDFSKFTWASPMKDYEANTVYNILKCDLCFARATTVTSYSRLWDGISQQSFR